MASMTKHQRGQPKPRPSISGKTTQKIAAAASTMPPKSFLRPGLGASAGISRQPSRMVTMPTGMFIRKIGRQPRSKRSSAISHPPRIGPETVASPALRPNSEKAAARSFGGNIIWAIASTCGVITAAPAPCSRRATTSQPISGASPQSNEPKVKAATPTRNTCFLPLTSPNLPNGNSPSAKTST